MKRIVFVFLVVLMLSLPNLIPNVAAANSDNPSLVADNNQTISHNGTVQITFATNSFLEIKYFYDENLTQPIDTKNCYLNKGERIYVSEIDVKNTKSNLYSFSEFRFLEYDSDGKRTNTSSTQAVSGLIYTLPDDFDGQGISVLPIGSYKDRELKFDSYYFDTNLGTDEAETEVDQ